MEGRVLERVRNCLLNRRGTILGVGSRIQLGAGLSIVSVGDQAELVDIAQAAEQLDRDTSLAEQERRELIAIERALAKIATGRFGICEDCEEEIPEKRLMIVPEARLCARCQSIEERQQGRHRGVPTSALG